MMRYFVHVSYQGTRYRGWQRQANTYPCVQDIIEAALENMLGSKIGIVGCGRTDAGVHAQQFFFHFDTDIVWAYDFAERINWILPADVRIYDVIPVHEKAHTRYDAISRTYEFYLHTEASPFFSNFIGQYAITTLNIDLMQEACQTLVGSHDFAHLCIAPLKANTTICDVMQAEILMSADHQNLTFRITANRFLKSMIRIIMARLIAVGEGQITIEAFVSRRSNKELMKWKTMMHPQGLHLTKVVYPYIDVKQRGLVL
jgi:tRNA pseudouridine38-40 synthase